MHKSIFNSNLKGGKPNVSRFGADMIAGPNLNRTDSGYYPTYPEVRGYKTGYYRVIAPAADTAKIESEARSRGFRFNVNCKGFVIYNKWSALRWAYQLGLFYRPQFGPIDDHFNRAIDPNKACLQFFKSDYKQQFQYLSPKDIQFYVEIFQHYLKGLLQRGKFPYEYLRIRFDDLLKLASQYGAKTRVIGRLYPVSQGQLQQEAMEDAQKQAVAQSLTTQMTYTPSAQLNPFTGTYDYSGIGAAALEFGA